MDRPTRRCWPQITIAYYEVNIADEEADGCTDRYLPNQQALIRQSN